MRQATALLLTTLMLACAGAHAGHAPPLGERPEVGGGRTRMFTLGSVHLSGYRDWDRAWLAPLNAKLVAWSPEVVTVEALSGAQCELMRLVPQRYGEIHDAYCPDATPFQRALRTTQPDAERDAMAMLANWPASPTAAQRRKLAMLFLAAGDRPSAQVQWLRLPEEERIAADGLTDAGVDALDRAKRPMNETYDIAAAVAAASGLERIHSVDDHTSDALGDSYPDGFGPWQGERYARIRETPRFAEAEARRSGIDGPDSLLALYRTMNAPGAQDAQIQADFGGAFADAAPERFGRYYGGWWEVRNLRMVANIREAITPHPGARVLNIVGASHKPWYDQWALQMADVELAAVDEVLGD